MVCRVFSITITIRFRRLDQLNRQRHFLTYLLIEINLCSQVQWRLRSDVQLNCVERVHLKPLHYSGPILPITERPYILR